MREPSKAVSGSMRPVGQARSLPEQACDLLRVRRLGNMGVEPRLDRALNVIGLRVSGQRDQPDVTLGAGVRVPRDLVPAHPRKADVTQD